VWPHADLRRRRRAAAWLAILAVGAGAIGCGGSSASKAGVERSGGRTLNLFSYGDCCGGFNPVPFSPRGSDLVEARLGKKRTILPSFTAFVVSDGLRDMSGKKVGYYHWWCTVGFDPVPPEQAPGYVCAYYFNLRDGQIVAEGAAGNPVPWTVPIIGGTGAYLGARGSVTTAGIHRLPSKLEIHLR
jgi:hypothetical protein